MSYEVRITNKAQAQMQSIYEDILPTAGAHAVTWFNGALKQINSLAEFPARCPRAIEANRLSKDLRYLVYGDHRHGYRIIFAIRGNRVIVLEVRHAARRPFTED